MNVKPSAFIGHSFADCDSQTVRAITTFVDAQGIPWVSGDRAENKSIAVKVKERIMENDIFIGIFTKNQALMSNPTIFKRNILGYTTSNWVIQESGYAMGLNKQVILMVEDGIINFPELQGDMEVIRFTRNNLQEAFIKLSQMLNPIDMGSRKLDIGTAEVIEQSPIKISETKDDTDSTLTEEKKQLGIQAEFLNILFEVKDYKKAQEYFNNKLKPTLNEENEALWLSLLLRKSDELGDAEALNGLVSYVEEHKDKPEAVYQLAFRYLQKREYERGISYFKMAIKAYGNDAITYNKDIYYCHKNIAKCLEEQGNVEDAISHLCGILHLPELSSSKGGILESIAEIYHRNGNFESFVIYAEGSLKENPNNKDLRSKLAYKYSELGERHISILHYKIIIESMKESYALNNSAIDYNELGLKGKSVDYLKQSADLDNSLAMSNLAERYLAEGFLADAQREIERANQLVQKNVKIHGNIGLTKNKLSRILDDENEKENNILVAGEKERQFRAKYAEAYYHATKIEVDKMVATWNTKWGKVKIMRGEGENGIEVNEILIEEKEVKSYNSALIEALSSLAKKRSILMNGKITGSSIRFVIKISDSFDSSIIPSSPTVIFDGIVEAIFDDNSNIDAMGMEKGKDKTYDTWNKIL